MTTSTEKRTQPSARTHEGPAMMLPDDEHNRRLLDDVHPAEWRNPKPDGRYHLVVMGAGTGGLVTAAIAAALGARVALIERNLMGGDCLNVGCVPSKAVIEAARAWRTARDAAASYGGPPVAGAGDFGIVMERMRRIRSELGGHDSAARFRDLGVDVYLGDAELKSPESVEVAGTVLDFRRAVIAVGTHPAVPPIDGLAEAGYLTNETIFSLTELPTCLVVIGGGPIGCELAQAFARFGSRVTILEADGRLLANDDPDAARVVTEALEKDGIEVVTGTNVISVRADGGVRTVTYRNGDASDTVVAEHVLVSTGRTPNVDGLGLAAAEVEFDPKKGIVVDDRLRTSNPRIYAIGDIASRFRFTHVADAHARMVVRNALFYGRAKASDLTIPWCTYTSPELAHVGRGAAEIAEAGDTAETITVAFDEVDRARLDGETEGFLRVFLRHGSDEILGATIVGEQAGELISFFSTAIQRGTGLSSLGEVIFPYPTRAEVIRKAADQWGRRRLTPTAKRLFDGYFKLT